jgi:hypothetical protein
LPYYLLCWCDVKTQSLKHKVLGGEHLRWQVVCHSPQHQLLNHTIDFDETSQVWPFTKVIWTFPAWEPSKCLQQNILAKSMNFMHRSTSTKTNNKLSVIQIIFSKTWYIITHEWPHSITKTSRPIKSYVSGTCPFSSFSKIHLQKKYHN